MIGSIYSIAVEKLCASLPVIQSMLLLARTAVWKRHIDTRDAY
jgi:hypothetical protein